MHVTTAANMNMMVTCHRLEGLTALIIIEATEPQVTAQRPGMWVKRGKSVVALTEWEYRVFSVLFIRR